MSEVLNLLEHMETATLAARYRVLQEFITELAKDCECSKEDFEILLILALQKKNPETMKKIKDIVMTSKLNWHDELAEHKKQQ